MIFPTPKTALILAASIPVAGVILTVSPANSLYAFIVPTITLVLFLYDYAKSPNPGLLRATLAPPGALLVGAPEPFPITISFLGEKHDIEIKLFLSVKGELAVKNVNSSNEEASSTQAFIHEGKGEVTLTLLPLKRGWAYLDKLWLSYRGPL
ncbi:MAG: hypothetical protein LBE27_06215 [Deltaproteobacteria bacterium]|jgi:uncharacterized protein (DUF58 family)|nr:hypothetical protein [Deltaproteobacteria bacterium]